MFQFCVFVMESAEAIEDSAAKHANNDEATFMVLVAEYSTFSEGQRVCQYICRLLYGANVRQSFG
jgi:hypothetical protein